MTTLSRLDLSDGLTRHECVQELMRARDKTGGPGIVAWAVKWGDAIAEVLVGKEIDEDDLAQAEADATAAEDRRDEISEAARAAIVELDKLALETSDDVASKIDAISEKLEQAI